MTLLATAVSERIKCVNDDSKQLALRVSSYNNYGNEIVAELLTENNESKIFPETSLPFLAIPVSKMANV